MRRMLIVLAALVGGAGALAGQQPPSPSRQAPRPFSVEQKIGPNDYNVAPNWGLPYPKAGYAWGSVPGIFVESDDRIFVVSRGEIKLPDPLPPGYLGFFGSIRSALNAPENEVRGCIRVLDSTGRILETWSQWDKLFAGTNGPHKIKISPYRSPTPRLGRRRNQERHLRLLERRDETAADPGRGGRRRRR